MDFPGDFSDHIDPTKLHVLNISFLVDTLKKEKGGNAGNVAYSLSLLNTKSAILGVVGNDFKDYENFLKKRGIDTSCIKVIDNESTAIAFITTDKKDNQISAFYPGAMKHSEGLRIKDTPLDISFCVITPELEATMTNFALECKELKIPYLYDPGMQLPRLSNEQLLNGLDGADILVGNDYEMGIIKKRLDLSDEGLLKKAKIVITTLGEKGAVIKTKKEKIKIFPSKPKGVLDPTGAGDAFRAGFLSGYLKGLGLKTAGQIGAVCACYAIERYGTTNHKFSLREFRGRYKENYGEELKLL